MVKGVARGQSSKSHLMGLCLGLSRQLAGSKIRIYFTNFFYKDQCFEDYSRINY